MTPSTQNNPRLLCAFSALQMSLFPMAILALFYKHEIDMTLQDIFALQAIFGLCVALFEFPSGYLADRLGYRRTLLIAAAGNIVGWSVYAGATSFAGVVVAEAILGVSMSLVSGADAALLYESLLDTGRESQFSRWAARMKFWGQSAEGTAALLAGLMFSYWARWPFVAQTAVWITALVVAWFMAEPHVPARERERAGHVEEVRRMVRTAFVDNRRLRALIVLTVIMGMSTFVPVWMITLYAESNGLEERWQGALWAAANYGVAIGALSSDPLRRRFGFLATMVGCIALVFVGYASLAATWGAGAAFLYVLMTFARGVFTPILAHVEQDELESGDRAAFLSLRSLVFRSSFLVLGPIVGVALDAYGNRPVLVVLGAGFAAAATLALHHVRSVERAAA